MNELYEKIDVVKEELDRLPIFTEIERLVSDIKKNKELMAKLKQYQEYPTNHLRMEIYSYDEIRKYKEKENEVNLLILHMNKKIKESFIEKGGCHHESN